MEQRCIFCKIVAGELPSYKVYEDETYMAFMDVFPRAKGHVLVIPKTHYQWVYNVPEFGEYFEIAKQVAIKVQNVVQSDFVSFVTVGEAVPHAHIHILPQMLGKRQGITFTEVLSISKEEIEQLATEISNN
jgi:histidine triad (HIT) family protein